jgi:hypothetical protein
MPPQEPSAGADPIEREPGLNLHDIENIQS